MGHKIIATLKNHHILHRITSPYYRQANGQVESTNKVIETILTKTVTSHRRDWATRLLEALWAYRTTWRNTTRYSPYQLVFGKEPIFPIEFEIQTLMIAQEVGLDLNEAQINKLQQINELMKSDYRLFSIAVVKAYVALQVQSSMGARAVCCWEVDLSDHYSSMILEHPEPTNRQEGTCCHPASTMRYRFNFVCGFLAQDPKPSTPRYRPRLLVFHPALCCSRWRPRWLAPKVPHWLTGASYPRMD